MDVANLQNMKIYIVSLVDFIYVSYYLSVTLVWGRMRD